LPSPVFISAIAVVQHDAADELHVVVPHVQHAAAGLADDGKCFRQQVVELFAVGDALLEVHGPGAQIRVRERFDAGLEGVDL
jgi:hypothetical protein